MPPSPMPRIHLGPVKESRPKQRPLARSGCGPMLPKERTGISQVSQVSMPLDMRMTVKNCLIIPKTKLILDIFMINQNTNFHFSVCNLCRDNEQRLRIRLNIKNGLLKNFFTNGSTEEFFFTNVVTLPPFIFSFNGYTFLNLSKFSSS